MGSGWYLSRVRHHWWVTAYSALVGVVTHVVLDAFTHSNGFVVEQFGFLQAHLVTVAGVELAFYKLLQYGGRVAFTVITAVYLVRIGRDRLFLDPSVTRPTITRTGRVVVWGITLVGFALAILYAIDRSGLHHVVGIRIEGSASVVVIAFAWVAFLGMVVACLVGRCFVAEPASFPLAEQRSVH